MKDEKHETLKFLFFYAIVLVISLLLLSAGFNSGDSPNPGECGYYGCP